MATNHTIPFETPSAHDPAPAEMVRCLADVYRPERIYLFGSVARGEATPDSDYDLMIVVPESSPPELLQRRIGYRAVRDLGVPRDIFVFRAGDFQKQLHLRASFPATVVREGRLLYSA